MMRYAGAGAELVLIFALWLLLGYWADKHFGTAPWLMLAGAVVGFGLGLYRMVRDAMAAQRRARQDKQDNSRE